MKRLLRAHTLALALALLAGGAARADVLPPSQVSWSYDFSTAAPAVLADGNPSAGVSFTNEMNKSAVGPSDVVASTLRTFSTASAASPDSITSGAYTFTLKLTETENGVTNTATLTFNGTLSGKFSADSSALTNAFGPDATKTVNLGSYTFTVSMSAFAPPGPPDQTNAGAIGAHVGIAPNGNGGNPGPAGAPEPSAMVLTGLGLSFLGLAGWRKRRAKARLAATLA